MIQIFKNAVKLFSTTRINFKEGSNISLSVSKTAAKDLVEVQIAATNAFDNMPDEVQLAVVTSMRLNFNTLT